MYRGPKGLAPGTARAMAGGRVEVGLEVRLFGCGDAAPISSSDDKCLAMRAARLQGPHRAQQHDSWRHSAWVGCRCLLSRANIPASVLDVICKLEAAAEPSLAHCLWSSRFLRLEPCSLQFTP